MATIKDIASALNLSPAAVSLAIGNKAGLSQETRDKVINKARELGYFTPGKSVRRNSSSIQLLIFSDYIFPTADNNSFLDQLVEGISFRTNQLGYTLNISYLTQEDLHTSSSPFTDGYSGSIILATRANSLDPAFLTDTTHPIIVLDKPSYNLDFDSVVIANAQGIRLAVEHLRTLGHREIAYLGPRENYSNFSERYHGFIEAVSCHEDTARSLSHIYLIDRDDTRAYSDNIISLIEGLKAERHMPTAFVCATDWYAYSCISVLSANGFNVPGDVSVIGFDNIPLCTLSIPAITSVNVPKQSLGAEAVNRLDRIIKGKASEKLRISVLTDLVVRGSTGKASPVNYN